MMLKPRLQSPCAKLQHVWEYKRSYDIMLVKIKQISTIQIDKRALFSTYATLRKTFFKKNPAKLWKGRETEHEQNWQGMTTERVNLPFDKTINYSLWINCQGPSHAGVRFIAAVGKTTLRGEINIFRGRYKGEKAVSFMRLEPRSWPRGPMAREMLLTRAPMVAVPEIRLLWFSLSCVNI